MCWVSEHKVKCTTHLDLDNRCRRGPPIFAGSSLSLFPSLLCDCKYLCTFELWVRKEFHGVTSGSGNQGFNCLDQFIEDHHYVLSSRCIGEWRLQTLQTATYLVLLSLNAPEPSDSWEWLWVWRARPYTAHVPSPCVFGLRISSRASRPGCYCCCKRSSVFFNQGKRESDTIEKTQSTCWFMSFRQSHLCYRLNLYIVFVGKKGRKNTKKHAWFDVV